MAPSSPYNQISHTWCVISGDPLIIPTLYNGATSPPSNQLSHTWCIISGDPLIIPTSITVPLHPVNQLSHTWCVISGDPLIIPTLITFYFYFSQIQFFLLISKYNKNPYSWIYSQLSIIIKIEYNFSILLKNQNVTRTNNDYNRRPC